jgi:hypothetical protein
VLAGKDFGIAKFATLVPIRVLGCGGGTRLTWVLNGLNWINSAQNPNRSSGGVVNMSFWFAPVLDNDPNVVEDRAALGAMPDAIRDLEAGGFAVFVSANNQPMAWVDSPNGPVVVQYFDSCQMQPSSYSRSGGGKAVTVGGTMLGSDGRRDYRWWTGDGEHQGSSYGGCVDIWAPAYGIRVADYTSSGGSMMSGGTSYSSPIVAGMAARILQYEPMAPLQLWERLRDSATDADTTGTSPIWESRPGSSASETVPNNRMAFLKDYVDTSCRTRPVRPVSITAHPSSWTLPSGSQITLTVVTDEPAEYQWYRGASGDMSQPVWGADTAAYTIPPLAATTSYWVRADGEVNAVNSNTATITLGSCPGISVSVSPSSVTILEGESLTLTATASSMNPLTYQWYKNDGWGSGPIPNATGPSIIVSPSSFTRYSVVAGNGCRTVGSNTVYVTVSKEYAIALGTYYGNYVGAEGGGGAGVHAVASAPNQWERFILRDLNGGQLVDGDFVTLRSHSGHYLVAEWCGGEGQTVNANRTTAGDWETFQIQSMDGNYWISHGSNVALRACSGSGYYAVAEYGGLNGGGPGAGEVNCDRTAAGAWETFQILWQ